MKAEPDGNAIVYCQGAFNTTYGKTAHGLVRFTERYRVVSVIDSNHAGKDAGEVLDGKAKGIPIHASLREAVDQTRSAGSPATHFVVGLAPDGGRLPADGRSAVGEAIKLGLNVDSGLHDLLSEDPEIARLAQEKGVRIRDVRKPPPRDQLHHFSGKIEEVTSLKVAILGTDSAVGKRTTAWILVHGLQDVAHTAEMVGTGQTAWMQGARFGLIDDCLISDFLSGEIEHAVWRCWKESNPEVIVIEGQGSLMNPAYPGGYEILAGGRPDIVVLQHAPARLDYDGFPGYPIQPLNRQIQAIELISGKPVVAVTVNHENLDLARIENTCAEIKEETGLPAFDVLLQGPGGLVDVVAHFIKKD